MFDPLGQGLLEALKLWENGLAGRDTCCRRDLVCKDQQGLLMMLWPDTMRKNNEVQQVLMKGAAFLGGTQSLTDKQCGWSGDGVTLIADREERCKELEL